MAANGRCSSAGASLLVSRLNAPFRSYFLTSKESWWATGASRLASRRSRLPLCGALNADLDDHDGYDAEGAVSSPLTNSLVQSLNGSLQQKGPATVNVVLLLYQSFF